MNKVFRIVIWEYTLNIFKIFYILIKYHLNIKLIHNIPKHTHL
jgi:hypothetical protein